MSRGGKKTPSKPSTPSSGGTSQRADASTRNLAHMLTPRMVRAHQGDMDRTKRMCAAVEALSQADTATYTAYMNRRLDASGSSALWEYAGSASRLLDDIVARISSLDESYRIHAVKPPSEDIQRRWQAHCTVTFDRSLHKDVAPFLRDVHKMLDALRTTIASVSDTGAYSDTSAYSDDAEESDDDSDKADETSDESDDDSDDESD